MKKFLVFVLLFFAASSTWSYDMSLANSYEQYFMQFAGKSTPKALQMIPTDKFVKAVQSGEKMFIIDVRTPAETSIYGVTIPGTLAIPMDQLFKPENLARIPSDQKVVVVCKAGHRAMAVATALRHSGFSNVFVLKHGIADVAAYLSPKNAYLEEPKVSAK